MDLGVRTGAGHTVWIVTNYNQAPQTVALPHAMHNLLTGQTAASVTLARYEIAVLE